MKLVILFLTAAVFFGCGAADRNAHAPCGAEIYTNEMSKIYKSKLLVYRGVAQEVASEIKLSYSDFELKKVVQTPEVTRYVCTAKVTGVLGKNKAAANIIYRIEENKINNGKNINIITVDVNFVPKTK